MAALMLLEASEYPEGLKKAKRAIKLARILTAESRSLDIGQDGISEDFDKEIQPIYTWTKVMIRKLHLD